MAPDVLIAVTACEHHGDYSRPCGAVYVKQHGDDAGVVAAQHADELLNHRDLDGYAVWRPILAAVSDITRTDPTEHERVN